MNQPALVDALLEYADKHDAHDDRGDGVCICDICQILIPMVYQMEQEKKQLEAALNGKTP